MADHQAAGGAGEAAVGDHRDALAEALADDRRGDLQHLPHPGAADRALVADHDDVAGVDLLVLDGAEAVLFGLEDAGRAGLLAALGAGDLDHGALRGEVAAHDRQAAFGLERVVERAHDFLARRLGRRRGVLADRLAGDRDRVAVQEPGFGEPLEDHRHAAGRVEVGGDEAAAGLEVGEQRRRCGRSARSRPSSARSRARGRARSGAGRRWSSRPRRRRRRSRSPASRG